MRRTLLLIGIFLCALQLGAQAPEKKKANNSYDEFQKLAQENFDDFTEAANKDYEDFRQQCWNEFSDFVKNAWKEFSAEKMAPAPKERPLPPIKILEEQNKKPAANRPIVVEEIVKAPVALPKPMPLGEVKEKPMAEAKRVDFQLFGTPLAVRFDVKNSVRLKGVEGQHIAEATKGFTPEAYDNLLFDCLDAREKLALCDWSYLQMLQKLSEKIFGADSNDGVLLTFYLYSQSGYAARLASDGDRLYMLYASKHNIYNMHYFDLNGMKYYCTKPMPVRLKICEYSFKKEQGLSLLISTNQAFKQQLTEERFFVSKKHPGMKLMLSVNQNLLDFYSSYPASNLGGNDLTSWAMYANKPMAEEVVFQIYPTLRAQLQGLSQLEAVSRLLNFVQTGFDYALDSQMWSGERTFFAEESLFYPACDCEDRSVLLTRLVRDLLGLRCLLVHYPGHLACAVEITEGTPEGDFITLDGRKYHIADGTILSGSSVGRTMSDMDNSSAAVILLE